MSKLELQRSLPRPAMFQDAVAPKARARDSIAALGLVRKPLAVTEVTVPSGPFDYAATIARLGLSQADAASLLRTAPRTARRWNTDGVPAWVPGYLALVEAVGLDVARTILAAVPLDA